MLRNKKGFTLVELLIVVAILAVLAAVAIPVYSAQLDKARAQVDAANLRSAMSMATADYLLESRTGTFYYTFSGPSVDDAGTQLGIAQVDDTQSDLTNTGLIPGQANANKNKSLLIKVDANGALDTENSGWIFSIAAD